ncbi:MAG: CmpA/NrtA family ABC transporter substrate-binding protein [Pseudomonadota bacterium]
MIPVRAGFIPLVDSAGLVLAAELGFAEAQGLDLSLTREASWAALADKLAVGAIDAAHLLAPMAVASKLGVGNAKPAISALMSMSTNGNAISLSHALYEEMLSVMPLSPGAGVADKAMALGATIRAREVAGGPRLTFAVVHPFSPHNYELRYILATGGVDPDLDVDLVVVPPPYIVEHLEKGLIDGFCVGAPWTLVGLREGVSRVLMTKSQIWRFGPEKVLGMRESDVEAGHETAVRLVRAVKQALEFADEPANRAEVAEVLATEACLNLDAGVIARALEGEVPVDDASDRPIEDFIVFDRFGSSFPWRSHALWFYSQMVRWRQVEHSPAAARLAADAYRPDVYRKAFENSDVTLPSANSKLEGALNAAAPAGSTTGRLTLAGDGFFDGRVFDPNDVPGYLAGFSRPV